uniref:Uncharacterized protein n=1 Tax=Anguilla anguilla TaxID=7936 RepID=A0A0E9RR49_ANGAN
MGFLLLSFVVFGNTLGRERMLYVF